MIKKYSDRKMVLQSLVVIISLIFLIKIFFIQVVDEKFKTAAQNNAVDKIKLYPDRGLIYDRNDELLVYNQPIYDILVIPRRINNLDTLLFCSLLKISKEEFINKIKPLKKGIRYYRPNIFLKQITSLEYTRFQEFSFKFNGFYGEPRTIRKFNHNTGAHIFGDIGEVNNRNIEESEKYYKSGDYIGKSGIEKVYEKELRGERGYKYVFVDKFHNNKGSYNNKESDLLPISGNDINLSIDVELQKYGERLLQNKIGSIVAIEPKTGEILALASNPTFDPNMLVGRKRGENYKKLQQNKLSPLFNRAIMGVYPPGSTFKAVTAAIALQEKIIDPNFSYKCNLSYQIPGYTLHCSHGHPSARNVKDALQYSCNPYFWQVFRNNIDHDKYIDTEEAYNIWRSYCVKFGFSRKTGIDLGGEEEGTIPLASYYNGLYRKNRWKAVTIISLAIGQGEINVTPLQLANFYAIVANRGYYIEPHLLKEVDGVKKIDFPKINSDVDPAYFEIIAEGLKQVVDIGTGRRSKIPGISFGGKTGTAQNPHGDYHSIFAGIAPVENPDIVVAVIVENAGGGSAFAAPITSLMIEKYMNDTIMNSRKWLEKSILDAMLIDSTKLK
jgi:penicillin-binding protein 2